MTPRPFSILNSGLFSSITTRFIFCSLSIIFGFSSVSVAQEYYANDDYWIIDFRSPTVFGVAHNDRPVGSGGFTIVTPPTNGNAFWWDFYGSLAYNPSSTTSVYSDTVTYKNCLPVSGQMVCTNTAAVTILVIGTNEDSQNLGSCPMRKRPSAPNSVGQPVNVTNGNMWLEQSDYNLPGVGESIEVNRFYNSRLQSSGLFGFGWATKYDESLAIYDDRMIRLDLPDAKGIFFGRPNTSAPFTSVSPDFTGKITKEQDNTYTLTYQDGRIRKFDTGGRLLWQRDRNGNQTTLTYDINSFLIGVTDSTGRTLTLLPNANGTISQISDALGLIADYEYVPGTTQLKTVTYADGTKYKFEYTDIVINGQTNTYLTTVKDALDNVLETHLYDTQGRATTSEKQGGVEKYTLSYTNSELTTVTDALGRTTRYRFTRRAGKNLVTSVEGLCGGCGGSGSETTSYQYDNYLNLFLKTDALGRQTTYEYYPDGDLKKQIDVLGTQEYTYNSFGEVLTSKDRMNGIWTNTYDANGNLLTAKDPLNNTTTMTYTALGQPVTLKDALNNTTTLTYNAFGRLTQVKDANNKNTAFAYDARARLTGTTNAINETVNFEYDLNNRLKKVIYPDTHFITYTYDLAGRRTGTTDARNNTTTYAYDGAYRPTATTDALNHTTATGYDLMSNVTSQTDALNNTTNYEYDDFNRLKKIIHPPSVSGAPRLEERLEYDTVGNVKKRIDSAGRETLYDYDTAHRLIKTTDALSQITQFEYNARSQMTKVTDALAQQYTFTYDPLGRQLSQTRAGSTMSFVYDAIGNRIKRTDYMGRETAFNFDNLNRLTQINYLQSLNGVAPPTPIKAASYVYDDLSRLTSAVNDTGTVGFTYDNRGRLKTTTDVFNHLIEYGYDASGNRTQLKLDGTVHTGYTYDTANRLTTLTDEASQNFTFGYDIANRLISKTLPNGVSSTLDYDGMNRLTKLKHQSATATLTDNNFTYNPAQQISQIAELTQTKNFSYDNVDRLTGMTNGAANESYLFDGVGNRTASQRSATYGYQPFNKLTSTATATYSYDANGSMIQKSEGKNFWRYTWDYENRMTQASTRKQSVRYRYDALGRRVQRYLVGGKENTKFTYDGLDVVMDHNSGVLTKYQNGLGIDDKLKMVTSGNTKYFLQDHLGSTVGLADSASGVVSSANYDSFGNSTNNLTSRYQYTGREFDSFTGLQYSRARWYDPNLGRFISEDPIGFGGGDINLFGYVRNQPLWFRDPMGLQPGGDVIAHPDTWRFGAAAVTAAGIIAPPLGVAIVGGALIYGAWQFGEWTAAQPWNPITQPNFGPSRPLPPAITSTSTARPYCQPVPRAIPLERSPAIPRPTPNNNPDRCYGQYEADSEVCRYLPNAGARARCWASASERLGACYAKRPLSPLVTW